MYFFYNFVKNRTISRQEEKKAYMAVGKVEIF